MNVDFNGLRRNLCNDFDAVVQKAIDCRTEIYPLMSHERIAFEALSESLNELRSSVAGVALCYDENGAEDVLGDRTLLSMDPEDDE